MNTADAIAHLEYQKAFFQQRIALDMVKSRGAVRPACVEVYYVAIEEIDKQLKKLREEKVDETQ